MKARPRDIGKGPRAVALWIIAASSLPMPGLAVAQPLSRSAVLQIQALENEKAARTPAQQKISSDLLNAERTRGFLPPIVGVPSLESHVKVDERGMTLVDIDATVSDALLHRIHDVGGEVVSAFPEYHAIRARVPLGSLEDLAASPDIKRIRSADRFKTNKINTSEGDITHRANLARSNFSVNGAGITVGVLSDSVDSLSSLQASGDLPPACPGTPCSQALPGQSGVPGTSEGTAMMEIVTDLAPGSNIFFATADGGQATFASNIIALANAGAKVIVDDVGYFAEPVFQDGIVAQAVNSFVDGGGIYLSAAGNDGSFDKGSGTWEGDFVGSSTVLNGGIAHDFGGGVTFDRITANAGNQLCPGGEGGDIFLKWSDAIGSSANDYDLYLLDPAGTMVELVSNDIQNGTQDPVEGIGYCGNAINHRIVIVKKSSAANRFLHLSTHGGLLGTNTSGAVFGHSGAAKALTIAAVNVATAGCPSCGPFTGGAANPVESFSSDGPRRVFYNPNGSAITPGNVSSTGGLLLQKPDFAAADRIMAATPGFNPFPGTSAAAPHAAAIAALLLAKKPGLTPGDLKNIFASTALDIEAPGLDRDSGFGIIDALEAVGSGATGALGSTTIGLFDPAASRFFLRNSNSGGFADITFDYGAPGAGWLPIAGKFDGGGVTSIGLFDPVASRFFLRNSNTGGFADMTFDYGPPGAGWKPIAGDWNGDGVTTIGLFDPVASRFFLRNSNTGGFADITFDYGPPGAGWVPIAGDWDGNGTTTIGLFDPARSAFFLRNSNTGGFADIIFQYGPPGAGWKPIAGDFDGNGTTTVGLFDPATSRFFLRNSNTGGFADITFDYGPPGAGWVPIAGNWDGK